MAAAYSVPGLPDQIHVPRDCMGPLEPRSGGARVAF